MNNSVDLSRHQSAAAQLPRAALLIGERHLTSGSAGVYAHVNAATGQVQAEVPIAGATDIDAAVIAARKGFEVWSALAPHQRRDALVKFTLLLEQHFDELAAISALENGCTLQFSGATRDTCLNWAKYYAGWADKIEGQVVATMPSEHFEYIAPEPWGVIACIIPWNAPLLSCCMKVPPALAAGNSVIIKPPETTPFSALRFAELALEAGIPPGVVNVVPGGIEAGEALVTHSGVDKISFTGGTPTAQRIMVAAAKNLTPVMFELGGKSANIIFDDANLADTILYTSFFGMVNSGQACALPSRVLVQDTVFDEVIAKVKDTIGALAIGDPLDANNYLGPLYHESHMNRVLAYIEEAKANCGGSLMLGGERLGGGLACGNFVAPTIFVNPDPQSQLAQNEAFGPIMAIFRFKTDDEAIALANSTKWGLASYVQTTNLQRAHRVAAKLRSGVVHMNGAPNVHYASTFGGVGMSGFGREGGKAGLDEYLRMKAISTR
jgi:aldehyde dehydrogenase (NAD+)